MVKNRKIIQTPGFTCRQLSEAWIFFWVLSILPPVIDNSSAAKIRGPAGIVAGSK